jgi:putative tryptophan/tyrosine transport system substrate-binding protein
MRRREFITVLGGAAAAWPLAAQAQPSPMRPLIGLLSPLSAAAASRNVVALRSALREAGATSGALAAYTVTRTIPIVMVLPEDPVAAGYAQSTARPGGNVTGTWNLVDDALMGKGLDFFKLAVPSLARVGALFNPDDLTDGVQIPRLPAAARAIGVTIEFIEVRNLSNLDAVTTQVMGANVQGVFVGIAPFWLSARTDITAMMARLKLPAMFSWREFTDAGGPDVLRMQPP